jgi:2-amino-4-hydroxy-6-hydroxymethyldihydropteridine diphosphokinase
LGVGSNIRPEENVPATLELLSEAVSISGISTFYRTAALGDTAAPTFYNGVLEVHTTLSVCALEEVLAQTEAAMGRVRGEDRDAPRPMDLDLLLFLPGARDERAEARPPHRDLLTRAFVAIPLFELDPDLLLPPDQIPLRALAHSFSDPGGDPLLEFTQSLRRRFLDH